MLRPLALLSVAIALVLPGAVAGAADPRPVELVPGVTYQRLERPGPLAVHVLRMHPGPLLTLEAPMVAGSPRATGSLSGFVRSQAAAGVVAAMNGDLFNPTQGYPSGILAAGAELINEPELGRSSLLVDASDRLSVARLILSGRWQAQDPAGGLPLPVHTLGAVNRPPERSGETILYTPRYGPATPPGSRTDALIALDGGVTAQMNAPLAGTVLAVRTGGGTPIGPGQVVLSGAGADARPVASELPAGRRVGIELTVAGLPPSLAFALGGGPLLVQDGVPIANAGESFSTYQNGSRNARSAVGQAADGTILLVVVEGPAQGGRGLDVAEQAQMMASLGARVAIGMDGGGSSQMVVPEGAVVPWASERPLANALVIAYRGVQVAPLTADRLSPNGDGVDDRLLARVRVPTPGLLRVTLDRRAGGQAADLATRTAGAGDLDVSLDPAVLGVRDGPYVVTAECTPADGTPPSVQRRALILDRSLAGLRLRPVARGTLSRRPELQVGFRLLRPARVTVRVEDAGGHALRVLRSGRAMAAGPQIVTWDRTLGRSPAAGAFRIAVEVRTFLGQARMDRPVTLAGRPG